MLEVAAPRALGLPRQAGPPTSQLRLVWRSFARNRLAVAAAVLIVLLYLLALLAPAVAPQDYRAFNPGQPLKPPSPEHWFGTDRQTRDVFSRVLVASQVSLSVGLVSVVLITLIGVSLGAIAGFAGGSLDDLIMRFTDIVLAIPQLFLLIAAAALFTPSLQTTMLVIGFTSWMSTARLVRGEFLRIKTLDFVLAARALGARPAHIVLRHLLPNALAPLIITVTLAIPTAIFAEAGLSFLGIGINEPTPSLGKMVADSAPYIRVYWHLGFFPSLAIALAMLGFTFVGDGLRDALDTRLR
jgi:ABC-type dipeptide/oligopeptide/nickel transport system permease subunit